MPHKLVLTSFHIDYHNTDANGPVRGQIQVNAISTLNIHNR